MDNRYSIVSVELNKMNPGLKRAITDTLKVCSLSCKYIYNVLEKEWASVSATRDSKKQLTCVEKLVHTTKDNRAVYADFDRLFYKFPSYYRRSVINFCIGQYKGYLTRLEDYETLRHREISSGHRFKKKPPLLGKTPNICPAMYKKEMFKLDGNKLSIKVYIRNTWDWVTMSVPNRDIKCLKQASLSGKIESPSLVHKYNKFYLQFPVKHDIRAFPKTGLEKQKVLAVDLGINNGAVCSIVCADGTIEKRFFDSFQTERDHIAHSIGRIRKYASLSGTGQSLSKVYTKLNGQKLNYVRRLSRRLVNIAEEYHVYGIVLEHLGGMKARGSKKARIHHWCKCRIRDYVKGMAFRKGIRTFLVNPKNTSALAYDGSGKVTRNEKNFSLCTFAGGKQYHCDLSASYNIGARYFIRSYQKAMDQNLWSQLVAKVPGLAKRTTNTLHTLRELQKERKLLGICV